MLRHIVMLELKDGADARAAIVAALCALPADIPEIAALEAHTDAGLSAGNHDIVLTVDFADEAAFRAYLAHPAHRRVLQELILPAMAGMAAVQHSA
jgi:hypothetical protein